MLCYYVVGWVLGVDVDLVVGGGVVVVVQVVECCQLFVGFVYQFGWIFWIEYVCQCFVVVFYCQFFRCWYFRIGIVLGQVVYWFLLCIVVFFVYCFDVMEQFGYDFDVVVCFVWWIGFFLVLLQLV